MADYSTPFGRTSNRRVPSQEEKDDGFPCGALDRALWNDLIHRLQAEIGEVVDHAGIQGTNERDTLLREAIELLISNAIDDIDFPTNTGGGGSGDPVADGYREIADLQEGLNAIDNEKAISPLINGLVSLPRLLIDSYHTRAFPRGGQGTRFSVREGYIEIKVPVVDTVDINHYPSLMIDVFGFNTDLHMQTINLGMILRDDAIVGTPRVSFNSETGEFPIRITNDGTNYYIYIGSDNTEWRDTMCRIRNLSVGGNGRVDVGWDNAFEINVVNALKGSVLFERTTGVINSSLSPWFRLSNDISGATPDQVPRNLYSRVESLLFRDGNIQSSYWSGNRFTVDESLAGIWTFNMRLNIQGEVSESQYLDRNGQRWFDIQDGSGDGNSNVRSMTASVPMDAGDYVEFFQHHKSSGTRQNSSSHVVATQQTRKG